MELEDIGRRGQSFWSRIRVPDHQDRGQHDMFIRKIRGSAPIGRRCFVGRHFPESIQASEASVVVWTTEDVKCGGDLHREVSRS